MIRGEKLISVGGKAAEADEEILDLPWGRFFWPWTRRTVPMVPFALEDLLDITELIRVKRENERRAAEAVLP